MSRYAGARISELTDTLVRMQLTDEKLELMNEQEY